MDSVTAQRIVDELERQYRAGLVRIGFATGESAYVLTVGALPPTPWARVETLAVIANMHGLQPQIRRWADVYRRWASLGRRDDGSPYSWDRWDSHGRELAQAIQFHSGEAFATTALSNVLDTAAATIKQVASPSLWPDWLKWGAAGEGDGERHGARNE
jgi:hypothetical protein